MSVPNDHEGANRSARADAERRERERQLFCAHEDLFLQLVDPDKVFALGARVRWVGGNREGLIVGRGAVEGFWQVRWSTGHVSVHRENTIEPIAPHVLPWGEEKLAYYRDGKIVPPLDETDDC